MRKHIKIFGLLFMIVSCNAYGGGVHLHSSAPSNSLSKGFYTKLAGGLVLYNRIKAHHTESMYADKPKKKFSLSAVLGYDFNENISAEILGRYSSLKYEHFFGPNYNSQKLRLYTIFTNIYVKHPLGSLMTPYVTAGPGYTYNKSDGLVSTHPVAPHVVVPGRKISSFAWNIGAGLIFNFKDNFSADIGYRYMRLGKLGVKRGQGSSAETKKIKAHEALFGLRYKF